MRCPVRIYKKYAHRRPADCMQPESRFYLQPMKNPKSEQWFTRNPMGENSIGNIGRNMASRCNLSSHRKTNHSARKTLIETLLHSDVPPTSVMQLTGHKNVQSLNSYSSLSVDQQESMSRAISKHIAGSSDLEDNDNSITMPLSPALQSQLVNEFAMDVDAENEQSFTSTSNIPIFQPIPNIPMQQPIYNIYLQGANITGKITFNMGK